MYFFLIAKLASFVKMGLTMLFGSFLTGAAVSATADLHAGRKLGLDRAFANARKKYINVFVVVAIFTFLFYFAVKLLPKALIWYFIKGGHSRLLFLGMDFWFGFFLFFATFILLIFIQSAFIYSIPMLVIGNKKIGGAISGSFAFFKDHFFTTLSLITLPVILYVPIVILQQRSLYLIESVFPESVLLVMVLAAFVTSVVMDYFMTLTTTYLYLSEQEK